MMLASRRIRRGASGWHGGSDCRRIACAVQSVVPGRSAGQSSSRCLTQVTLAQTGRAPVTTAAATAQHRRKHVLNFWRKKHQIKSQITIDRIKRKEKGLKVDEIGSHAIWENSIQNTSDLFSLSIWLNLSHWDRDTTAYNMHIFIIISFNFLFYFIFYVIFYLYLSRDLISMSYHHMWLSVSPREFR